MNFMQEVGLLCEEAHMSDDRRTAVAELTGALLRGLGTMLVIGFPEDKHDLLLDSMMGTLRSNMAVMLTALKEQSADECDDPDCALHGKGAPTILDLADMPTKGSA